MKILAVDDERLMLSALVRCIRMASPDAEIFDFCNSTEALEFAQTQQIDVAFLDIHMRGLDGLDLGRQLLNLYPDLNLIFCTGFSEYIGEAFRDIRCNGYIVKPVEPAAVRRELEHLRVPLHLSDKRVRFRCFGRFEVFIDGEPITFESSKTKELLAYLVDACGSVCGNQEIIATLWDDIDRHDSYFKKLRKDLLDTFDQHGCGDVIYRMRAGLGVNQAAVDCDYYDWKRTNGGKYAGEYMSQYLWANEPVF